MTSPDSDHEQRIEELRNFLRAQVVMMRKASMPTCHGYNGLADFVNQNGQPFMWGPPPAGVVWGIARQCYLNSLQLAQRNPRFIYCEGYAVSVIPVMHAWCYDLETGRVVDMTWRDPGHSYFGIPFDTLVASELTMVRGTYGILDNYEAGWPLLAMDKSKFVRDLPPIAAE